MANPPPPYANITGISRTVMKDNAQESIVNYDGNARPGEIVVDLTQDPPVPYIGNNLGQLTLLTSAGSYGNTQVGQYLASGAVGNIIPSGNGIYSLGNSTNYWSNVWIAGNTLYLGGVPLGMSGNVLTVDGNSVLINNTDENISTLGNVTAGNIDITGGDLNWANASIVQTSNVDLSITGDGQVSVRSLDGTYQWTFDDVGNLTAPGNIGTLANVSAGYFIGNGAFLTGISGGGGAGLPLANGTSNFDIATANGNVTVTAGGSWTWTFDTTGNLTIPNNILSNTTIEIDNRASGNSADIRLFSADDITLQARDRSAGSQSEGGDININAGDSAEDGDSSGGDIQIIAGNGGAANLDFGGSGGFITIRSGDGGPAIGNSGYTAEDGGDITIQAGSAGDNGGNSSAGADGGDVFIFSGAATGNNISGGNIVISTGSGGSNGAGGAVQIGIPFSDRGPGAVWTFDGTGNLIVPSTGYINGEDAAWVRIQSLEEGVVRSSMTLNPDGVARLQSWDNQNSQSFTTADWATGEYVDNGGSGEIVFTDTPNIRSFFDTIFTSDRLFYQVNGGNLLPSIGWGGGGNNITFYTAIPPATSPEAVTDFVIYYTYRSVIEMDYDEGEMNLLARNLDITIDGDQAVDIQSKDQLRIENSSNVNGIYIATDTANTFRTWTFGVEGNLTLPGNGTISNPGNTSLDPLNPNVATMVLTPDANYGYQSLVLDPTAPGHIHLRAPSGSGNIDEPTANLFLGGEQSSFEIGASYGQPPNVFVHAGGNTWTFSTDGKLTFPGTPRIDTESNNFEVQAAENVNLEANVVVNIYTDNGNYQWQFGDAGDLYLPTGGNITGVTANNNGQLQWVGNSSGDGAGYTTLQLIPDSTLVGNDQYLIIDPTAPGHIHVRAGGTQDNSSADLFLGGEYSHFKVAAGANADVVVRSNSNEWTFDTTGNLTIPGSSGGLIKTVANAAIGIAAMDNGTDNPAQLMSWNVFQPNPSTIISAYANSATIMTDVNGTPNTWTFDNTGNLTTPGNIVVATGIVGSGASPAPYLSGFSSVSAMNISASGNVSSIIAITAPVAFANLTPVAGGRAFVNNANLAAAGNFGAQISGGGSNTVPVWSDGTNWYIG